MRSKATVLVLVLIAAGSIAAPAARADVTQQLAQAREQHRRALQQVHTLEDALDGLLVRYETVARKAGHAAIRLVDRSRAVDTADQAVADARAEMRARVRTAYELGPASMLAAFLSAQTLADISVAHEYTSRALTFDAHLIDKLRHAEAMLVSRQQGAEDAQTRLEGQRRHLTRLLAQMRHTLNTARRLADRFGLQVQRLEAQQQAVDEAAAQQTGLGGLSVGATGADQSALLAMLGPTGGRTCGTPDGLTDTGQSFSGNASWYGWDFAGQSTANGAIFDPRLFTAANRWLPFGTFLRVHYGGKCAIVLVNDRGPYVDNRVIDLSMAAAEDLGVGVSYVTADILVPTNGIPG
ncbi:MAG: RlpA-like double-psi beta-barrel domain-containing protein [Actinomycetota bacterium]